MLAKGEIRFKNDTFPETPEECNLALPRLSAAAVRRGSRKAPRFAECQLF
jgi:hypothetical protein